jgi:hypothetical protein
LRYHNTIRRLLASALLVLFVLSITPKRYLHHWFANHTDVALHQQGTDGPAHLQQDGFRCDCDNPVATAPFTNGLAHFDFTPPRFYAAYHHRFLCAERHGVQIFAGLRGPPSFS